MSFEDISEGDSSDQDPSFKEPQDPELPPEDNSQHHSKRQSSNKVHKCQEPDCQAVFSRPYRLKNHIETQHKGNKLFSCPYEGCTKCYSSQSHLNRHKETAHNVESKGTSQSEVMCDCGMVCANKYSLKKHISRAHRDRDLPFECSVCKKKYHRKSYLNIHKIEEHKLPAPYQCDKCSGTFSHYHLFQKHVLRHKTYKCDCGQCFEKWSQYLKHKKIECKCPKVEHVCSICNKTFTAKQNLTQHSIKVHVQDSQSDQFTCPYLDCKRSYKYKKNLTCHIKTFHDKVFEYFKCTVDQCDAVLKTKKNLKQHVRLCHSEKPLKEKVRRKPRKDKGVKRKRVKKLTENSQEDEAILKPVVKIYKDRTLMDSYKKLSDQSSEKNDFEGGNIGVETEIDNNSDSRYITQFGSEVQIDSTTLEESTIIIVSNQGFDPGNESEKHSEYVVVTCENEDNVFGNVAAQN